MIFQPYIFATQSGLPLIVQTINSVRPHSLKLEITKVNIIRLQRYRDEKDRVCDKSPILFTLHFFNFKHNKQQNVNLIFFTDDFLLDTTPISSITPAVRCSDSCPADRLDDSCCDSSSGLLSGIIEEPETVKERYYYHCI